MTITGSLRGATEMLELPNPMHAKKIVRGDMRDSDEMKAALLRVQRGVYRARFTKGRANGKTLLSVDADHLIALRKLTDEILYSH
jgi:hypothetical protein